MSSYAEPRRRRGMLALGAIALVVAACGGDDDGGGGGAGTTEEVSVQSDDGRATLTFDAASLPTGTDADGVTLEAVDADAGVTIDARAETPGTPLVAYRLSPAGTALSRPATLRVDLDAALLPLAPIFVLSGDDDSLEVVSTTAASIDDRGETVSFEVEVPHFSVITAINGPAPVGTLFLSPASGSVFAVDTTFTAEVQHSFHRDVVTQVIITPGGALTLRLPDELDVIFGRDLAIGGALTTDEPPSQQVEIDVDDARPMSETRETFEVTCADVGPGVAFARLGTNDLPFELVDESGSVVETQDRNVMAVDSLAVDCVEDGDGDTTGAGLAPGEYRQTSTFVGDDGTTFEIDLGILVEPAGPDGSNAVVVTQYFNGSVFQQASGVQRDGLLVATKDDDGIYEVWYAYSTFTDEGYEIIHNINGSDSDFADRLAAGELQREIHAAWTGNELPAHLRDEILRLSGARPGVASGSVTFDPPLGR